jgi:putative transposase
MPRIARGLGDGLIYHVLNRGNGTQEVFHKEGEYKVFLELLQKARESYPVKLLAYCLMPNHFHLLMQPEKGEELSRWMQWLMTSHVRRYHQHYGTSGHIWQGRYKSFIVQKDDHLLTVVKYIEGNPVRARLCDSAKSWLWSSHASRKNDTAARTMDDLPIPLPCSWTKYVDTPMSGSEVERVRLSIKRQSPYGNLDWQEKMCKDLKLESTIRPRGRPIKKEIQ